MSKKASRSMKAPPLEDEPKTKTQEDEPQTKTQEDEPQTKTQEDKPKARAQEDKPKARAQEAEPKATAKKPEPKKKAESKTKTKEAEPPARGVAGKSSVPAKDSGATTNDAPAKSAKNAPTKGGPAGKKGKEPLNLFPTMAILNYQDPITDVTAEDVRNGEFDATQLYFNPSMQRTECSLTIAFRCTAKIVCGDTVTIRLGGFKGSQPTIFALEARPNDDYDNMLKEMHEKSRAKQIPLEKRFQAYFTGDTPPKGVPPQSIILRCRHAVEENMKVVLGVPESAHINLPDKLTANSAKIKIEGVVKHSAQAGKGGSVGKIPRTNFQVTGEVKKRAVEADVTELEELIGFYSGGQKAKPPPKTPENGAEGAEEGAAAPAPAAGHSDEDADEIEEIVDMDIVEEITLPEADLIIENAPHRRQLAMGMRWVLDTSVFHGYEETCSFAAKVLIDAYERVKKSSDELFLHRELAKNFDVKVSQIIVLEDVLNTIHGSFYPMHSRAAIMCMRLFSMEAHDLAHLFNVPKPPCIHRAIHSALRSKNVEQLDKWSYFILALSTAGMNLREYTLAREIQPPLLYVGLKDLPHDELVRITKLKRGDLYMTTNFVSAVANLDINAEDFNAPDTGVLFELRGVLNAVEVGDCSHYPNDREWLLPMFSSFAVDSVENYPDKNHMIKVVLDFRGSFGGLTDLKLPPAAVEDRNKIKMAVSISGTGGIGLALKKVGQTTSLFAKCIYTNLRLREVRIKQPQYLLHSKYLARFSESMRLSKASQTIEEGYIKWYYCSSEGTNAPPDAAQQAQRWEMLPAKYSVPTEMYFLEQTRALKTFKHVTPSIELDFANAKIDFGKGLQSIRRDVGKTQSYPFDPYM